MMPHPHIVKAQIAQHIFRRLDHPQLLRRHRLRRTECANSGRPSAACPPWAGRVAPTTRESPPWSTRFLQRRAHLELLSPPARPGGNRPCRWRSRRRQSPRIPPPWPAAPVPRTTRACRNNSGWSDSRGSWDSRTPPSAPRAPGSRIARASASASSSSRRGRLGESAMTASDRSPKHLVRHAREKHRVHAAGIGDETRAVGAQQRAQLFQLVREHTPKWHSLPPLSSKTRRLDLPIAYEVLRSPVRPHLLRRAGRRALRQTACQPLRPPRSVS